MSSKAEVVIVGGGVAGCSIAYHLAKRGVSCQIIERDGIASQASGRAWGYIPSPGTMVLYEGISLPRGATRSYLSLCEEGFRRMPQVAPELKEEAGLDIGYGAIPNIRVAFEESVEEQLKTRMSELQKEGFAVSWLGAEEVRSRVPDIAPGVRGGLLFPGYKVEPYRYTLALAQAVEKMGTNIKLGEAVRFTYQGTRVNAVTLASGSVVKADVLVLAMGPWTAQGTSWLGKEIPIKVQRMQCLKVEVSPRFPPYRLSTVDSAIIPEVDGKVLLSRALSEEEVADFDDTPTEEAKTQFVEAAVSLVPRLKDARLIEHRAGLEGWPPTGSQPVLGQLPGWDNCYVVARLGTLGILMSLATGRILADLIVRGRTDEPVEHLSPARLIAD